MAEAKNVTITVDGKKITAPAGTLLIEACKAAGIESPVLLLLPGTLASGRLPHVRGAQGEDAQAADRLHHAGRRRQGRRHRHAEDRQARKAMWNCCSATIRSTAPYAMRAASANCRT